MQIEIHYAEKRSWIKKQRQKSEFIRIFKAYFYENWFDVLAFTNVENSRAIFSNQTLQGLTLKGVAGWLHYIR